MLRKILLVTISFMVLSGSSSCIAKRPEKIHHEICILDPENHLGYCAITGNNPQAVEKPIEELKGATCRTPDNEASNQMNLHNMTAYAAYLEKHLSALMERCK